MRTPPGRLRQLVVRMLLGGIALASSGAADAAESRLVFLRTNDIVYDAVGGQILASTPADAFAPAVPNSIMSIAKLLGNMMGGLYGWAGMWAAGYSIWIRTAPSMLAVRPDGRYAYAINNQTKDITVVDGTTGKSAEMIGGNGYALEVLKGGRFLYEVSDASLRLVDLERNTKALELELPDLRGLFFAPDRSVAVALAKQAVVVLDGVSGQPIGRWSDFTSPDAIAFGSTR